MLTRRSFIARAAAFVAGVRLAIEGAVLEPLLDAAPINERTIEQPGEMRLDHDTLEMYLNDGNGWVNTGPAWQQWDRVLVVPNGFIGSSGTTRPELENAIAVGVLKPWKRALVKPQAPVVAPVVIELNGQKIGELSLDTRFLDSKQSIYDHVLNQPGIYEKLAAQEIQRVVVVPGKLVNFITEATP